MERSSFGDGSEGTGNFAGKRERAPFGTDGGNINVELRRAIAVAGRGRAAWRGRPPDTVPSASRSGPKDRIEAGDRLVGRQPLDPFSRRAMRRGRAVIFAAN